MYSDLLKFHCRDYSLVASVLFKKFEIEQVVYTVVCLQVGITNYGVSTFEEYVDEKTAMPMW